MSERYFVTGAQGCIGAWIVKALVERGDIVTVFDRSDDPRRLTAIMNAADIGRVRFSVGDITDAGAVRDGMAGSRARRVVHLAGLQVPACRAEPAAGALVNVIGTLNVFESARTIGVERVVYASSAAVFGLSEDDSPLEESAECRPSTHYGVFKRANEGNAAVYFSDHGLSSVGLRPLTVYGVGRDTGITSDPTKAMKAAVVGRRFHIQFSGTTDFQYVADTAAAFIACADRAPAGAQIFNLHGATAEVGEIVRVIDDQLPEASRGLITFGGPPIPTVPALSDVAIRSALGDLQATPLEEGVRRTIELFIRLRDQRRLDTGDIE